MIICDPFFVYLFTFSLHYYLQEFCTFLELYCAAKDWACKACCKSIKHHLCKFPLLGPSMGVTESIVKTKHCLLDLLLDQRRVSHSNSSAPTTISHLCEISCLWLTLRSIPMIEILSCLLTTGIYIQTSFWDQALMNVRDKRVSSEDRPGRLQQCAEDQCTWIYKYEGSIQ